MLDLSFVRDNLPLVEEKLRQRGMKPAEVLKNFAQIDAQRRQAITSAETMKAQRNRATEEIAKLKKSGQDAAALIAETKNLREQVEELGKAAEEYETRLQQILAGIPNIPHPSVPVGKNAGDNVEVRRWGTLPTFDFAPKPHWEIGEQLGVLDLERAAKITGARFAVYWDLGARLERVLANFMLDLHTREHGYTEVLPPYMVNSESMYGTGQLPKFAADSFKVPHGDKDLWLIPTSEVPLTNLYRDEVLDAAQLLVSLYRLYAVFPQRGRILWQRCARDYSAASVSESRNGEVHAAGRFFRAVGKAYQQRRRSAAEAGPALPGSRFIHRRRIGSSLAAKTYDIEVWLPGQQLFREISSCSNFESFQARRANIRFRPVGKNKTEFVHTLNGSGLAVGRTWVAIVENYQQADGSVLIPEALRPYMGTDRLTPRKM